MSELLIVGPVLGILVGAMLTFAPSFSAALVRSRGRGLPTSLSARMTEEWTGELDAIPDRMAKLMFALGIWMTRRRSFAAAEGDLPPMLSQRSAVSSFFGGFGGWKTVIAFPVVLLAVVGYGASFLIRPEYRAEVLLLVVPQHVPQAYVGPVVNARLEEQVQNTENQILRGPRLLKIIEDLNLYAAERRAGAVGDDLVEDMRRHISIATEHSDEIRVSYTGPEPAVVARTADRLAALLIDASLRERTSMTEGVRNFLDTLLDDTRRRLIDLGKRVHNAERQNMASEDLAVLKIEYEALVANYKDLLSKREQASLAADLQRLQIGEQFSLLDPAHTPERPFTPNRWLMTLAGAVTGLGLGIAMLMSGWGRRSNRPQQAIA